MPQDDGSGSGPGDDDDGMFWFFDWSYLIVLSLFQFTIYHLFQFTVAPR